MATRIESQRNLVGVQSIAFIRAITLTLRLSNARPNTPMNVYFDNVLVNHYCAPFGGSVGNPLITNAVGTLTVLFYLPPGKFTTGTKSIIITDAPDIAAINMTGSTYGSASAEFTSTGVNQIFQTTTTTTTVNEVVITRVVQAPVTRTVFRGSRGSGRGTSDPLAQSFFTYGVTGGCFLTSIELYFRTKDANVPVTVDVRPMINGYPESSSMVDPAMAVTKPGSEINVSTDASVSTKFTFNVPIYLEEDKDYCFVVFSNSNNYNIFTSRVGERSYETGNIIYEQPYVGSLFKSENNITWQPEQFDDIKFKLNVARFNTAVNAVVKFKASPDHFSIPSEMVSTIAGSNRVTIKQSVQHGLEVNSKIVVYADANAVYNGMTAANISGTRTVSKIIDEFTYEYTAGGTATVTGTVETGGQVRQIDVDTEGSNYTSVPTISISGGGGTGATATAVISGGKLVAVNVTNPGSGYISAPTVTVTGGGGANAECIAIIDAMFTILTNKPVNFFVNNIPTQAVSDTTVSAKVTTTQLNYTGGNLNTYQPAETLPMDLDSRTYLKTNSVIASPANETARMGGNISTLVEFNMSTTNPNVSPFIDYSNEPSLIAYSNRIRNQLGEDLTSTNSTGGITSVVVSNGGSGYTVAPTVTFEGGGGSGATATATVAGGAVTEINVTDPGTGYTTPPTIKITRVSGTGTEADGYALLTAFNSELTPSSGTSTSRYVTKKYTLETPSKGINLFSEIYSTQETGVDWYIRTSISGSGVFHKDLEWKKLTCDVDRNKSTKPGQTFDYKFYLHDIPEFDTYDLKCVLRSADPSHTPEVYNYRVIIVA